MNHAAHYNLALCQWVFRSNEQLRCGQSLTEIKMTTIGKNGLFTVDHIRNVADHTKTLRWCFICDFRCLWYTKQSTMNVFWYCCKLNLQDYCQLAAARTVEEPGCWTRTCIVRCFSYKHAAESAGFWVSIQPFLTMDMPTQKQKNPCTINEVKKSNVSDKMPGKEMEKDVTKRRERINSY